VKSRALAHQVKLTTNQDLVQLNHNRKLAAQVLQQDTAQRKKETVTINQILSNAVGKVGSNSFVQNTLLVWDKKMQNLEYQ
jgi:predicted transposase YdaD